MQQWVLLTKNNMYGIRIIIYLNYVVNLAFPILTLCALNYKIYQELRKNLTAEVLLVRRNQNEQRENALRKRDIRLTRISIIIVVIFMICHIPRFIMNFIELAYGNPNLSKVRWTQSWSIKRTWSKKTWRVFPKICDWPKYLF